MESDIRVYRLGASALREAKRRHAVSASMAVFVMVFRIFNEDAAGRRGRTADPSAGGGPTRTTR